MGTLGFKIGKEYQFTKTFGESDVYLFAGLIGDYYPAHVNEEYCKKMPYGTRLVHGCLTFSMCSNVSGMAGVDSGNEILAMGYVIARNDNVVSVNASLQMDLTGQVSAETIGPLQYSGTGGATDFAHGAYHSKGGRAILAQSSTTKKGTLSRIVPILDPGAVVSVSRNLTDMVVTEYGVAKLRQRTVKQRVENLISVAHPDFRAELRREAHRYMYF